MSEPRPPPLHPGGWLSYGDASPTTPVPYWREFLAGVYLIGANFSRARARRSRATRSASRPTRSSRLGGASPISFSTVLLRDFPSDVGQPSDPQSDRLAGAACWPPSPVPEFGLGLVRPPRRRIRWCGRRRRASAARYGVDFDTTPIEAALIGQWRVPPLYPLTRAHEVDSATRWGRHLAAVANSIFAQFGSGPRRSLRRSAERPTRAAWAALRQFLFRAILFRDIPILGRTMELGRSGRMPMMMVWSPRRRRATGSSPTGGIESPAV